MPSRFCYRCWQYSTIHSVAKGGWNKEDVTTMYRPVAVVRHDWQVVGGEVEAIPDQAKLSEPEMNCIGLKPSSEMISTTVAI